MGARRWHVNKPTTKVPVKKPAISESGQARDSFSPSRAGPQAVDFMRVDYAVSLYVRGVQLVGMAEVLSMVILFHQAGGRGESRSPGQRAGAHFAANVSMTHPPRPCGVTNFVDSSSK